MRKETASLASVCTIFVLSSAGALLLFRLLESQAKIEGSWYEAGGAMAGFVLLYLMLHRSYCRILQLQEPCLSGKQTLDLIHLFQEDAKYQILRVIFGWIDELEDGGELPSLEHRLAVIDNARHEPRQYVTGFKSPIPDMYKHIESKSRLPSYRDAVTQAMNILESDASGRVKRQRLLELGDSVQRDIYNSYVEDMVNLHAM